MRLEDVQKLIPKLVGEAAIPKLAETLRTLEVLSDYKYDEYQQFAPGRRFMDSLVLWLNEIPAEHRAAAFQFVRERLVFFSRADIFHFTKMAYPNKIRPQLLDWEATQRKLPMHQWVEFSRSQSFEIAVRRSLFLGLSDGSHLDDFRRLGGLRNDQVHTSYQFPVSRAVEMIKELGEDIEKQRSAIEAEPYGAKLEATFGRIFLVDDFTASGVSFVRKKDTGEWTGKVVNFVEQLDDLHSQLDAPLVDWKELRINLVFYIATLRAKAYIEEQLAEYNVWRKSQHKPEVPFGFLIVQPLEDDVALTPENAGPFEQLINAYDVTGTYDSAMKKGGPDGHQRWGFKGCGLPVVLYHNTPNNSIAPLWVYRDEACEMPGLFPRIRRHWDVE